jgi:hypothetical protein
MTAPDGPFERVTVFLTPASSTALTHAAETTGDTRTDVINRAIQAYAQLANTVAAGGRVLVETSAGDMDGEVDLDTRATPEEPAAPDFFQPGTTYTNRENPQYDWRFRCDAVTTHPEDGERTALGWRHFRGEWEPYTYGEGDWGIHLAVGLYATTRGEPGEGQ